MRAHRLALVGLLTLAVSCVPLKRSTEPRFFVLHAVAPSEPLAPPAGADLVGLLPVRVPSHLDRPQLVRWSARGELRIEELLRWGEPLDEGLARTLAEDLGRLLPESPVLRYPWSARTPLRCRVRLDLDRFGAQPGGEVRLEGRFFLLPGAAERPLGVYPVDLRRPEPGSDTGQSADPEALVFAMSALVADLGGEIAAAVRALPVPKDASPSPLPASPSPSAP